MTNRKKLVQHNSRLPKILKFILSVGIICVMILLHPVKQWHSNMGEYKSVFFYKVLISDPEQVIVLICIIFFVITTICIRYIMQQK